MSIDHVFDINTGKRINRATGKPYRRQDPKEVSANLEVVRRMKEWDAEQRARSAAPLDALREGRPQ